MVSKNKKREERRGPEYGSKDWRAHCHVLDPRFDLPSTSWSPSDLPHVALVVPRTSEGGLTPKPSNKKGSRKKGRVTRTCFSLLPACSLGLAPALRAGLSSASSSRHVDRARLVWETVGRGLNLTDYST